MHCPGFADPSCHHHFQPQLAFRTWLWADPGLTPWWSVITRYFAFFMPQVKSFLNKSNHSEIRRFSSWTSLGRGLMYLRLRQPKGCRRYSKLPRVFCYPSFGRALGWRQHGSQEPVCARNHSVTVEETLRLPCLTPAFRDHGNWRPSDTTSQIMSSRRTSPAALRGLEKIKG